MQPRKQPLTITDDVTVNQQLLQLQNMRRFSSRLVTAAKTMESVEVWTFDDLILDSTGEAIGVDDERGTGKERMEVLKKLQTALNSPNWIDYVNSDSYSDEVDSPLIELLSLVKTRRFLVMCYYLDRHYNKYMAHLLKKMHLRAEQSDIPAHILRSRLVKLNILNVIDTIFSKESVAQVQRTLAAMKKESATQ